MSYVEEVRNRASDAIASEINQVAAHSGDPGGDGSANVIGSPETITYGDAAGGTASPTNLPINFTIPGGVGVTHVTYRKTDGTLQRTRAVSTGTPPAEEWTFRVTSADITTNDEV